MDGFGENSFKKKIFDELGVFDGVEFIRLPEFYRVLWKETDFVFPENTEKAKAGLKDIFPEESTAIDKYFRFVAGLGKEINNLPQTKMQKLSDYLMNFIRQQGGEVLLSKEVTAILTENGKAVGVSYFDKKEKKSSEIQAYANQIIANAAIPQVARKLLPEKEALLLQDEIATMKPGPSILTVYLGFKKPPKEIGNKNESTFVIDDSVNSTKDIHKNSHTGFDKRSFVFVDYGMIDSGLAPEGKATGVICTIDYAADWRNPDKKAYKQKKEEVAKVLISRLDKVIPGIAKIIEYQEVGTPLTIEHYTSNPEGTPYGYAQNLNQTARK